MHTWGLSAVWSDFCAHGSRLFNRLFITKPSLNKQEKQLLNKLSNGTLDNARLFGYVLNIKRLLPREEFDTFKQQLIALASKYPFVDMKYYGFCADWEEKL